MNNTSSRLRLSNLFKELLMRSIPILLALLLAVTFGCNESPQVPATPPPTKPAVSLPPPPPPSSSTEAASAAPPSAAKEPGSDVPPGMVREKADIGSGKKGHYEEDIVSTPAAVYWQTRENVAFRIQIPHAIDLYQATTGHAPKSHKEFMEEIIKKNMIQLPELPEGHRYVYDPATKELMVERPR
jgi:hypothetical protein